MKDKDVSGEKAPVTAAPAANKTYVAPEWLPLNIVVSTSCYKYEWRDPLDAFGSTHYFYSHKTRAERKEVDCDCAGKLAGLGETYSE